MQYEHTQTAPLHLLVLAVSVAMLAGAWFAPQAETRIILTVSGSFMFVLAQCFRHLTVCDEGDHLLIHFGPLPLFRKRIPYSNIADAKRGRTTIIDGWGIHLSRGGVVTWNLWGFDCVNVYLKNGRRVRVGSDDAESLAAFLQQRIANFPGSPVC